LLLSVLAGRGSGLDHRSFDVYCAMAEFNWNDWFGKVKVRLREFAERNFTVEPDGSGSSQTLEYRSFFFSFPRPTDVFLLDASGITSTRKEDDYGTVLRYDFSNQEPRTVKFHGCVHPNDLSNRNDLLERFGLDEQSARAVADLSLVLDWDNPRVTHVVPFDARTHIEEYSVELCTWMLDVPPELNESLRDADAWQPHKLPSDDVLPADLLLRPHPISRMFSHGDENAELERLQETVAHIQLLPSVPEQVKRVFGWAKRLYIFGHFEYGFFTIAAHYAYSAVEAALYHRWGQELPNPTILVHGTECLTLGSTGHGAISNLCEMRGWDERKLRVNGRKFPWNSGMVLIHLRELGIINDWQKKRFALKLKIRNSYSHMESSPLISPDSGALERAADDINNLFSSPVRKSEA